MDQSTIQIIIGQTADFPAIEHLLTSHRLPLEGFPKDLAVILVAKEADRMIGCVGYEQYGPYALFRSLAVAADMHGRGLGKQLTQAILQKAKDDQIEAIYLLTETATNFFPKFRFQAISRDDVPHAVKQSIEFTSACPASAQAMVLAL